MMKCFFLTVLFLISTMFSGWGQQVNNQRKTNSDMDRVERTERKLKVLFWDADFSASQTDEELMEIFNRFVFGDVFYQSDKLTDKQRELITLAILSTNQTLDEMNVYVKRAMKIGVIPVEIKEAIYQCAPYVGFPKTRSAIHQVNETFRELGVELSLESQQRTTEADRFDKGLRVQKEIFGETIAQQHKNAPVNQRHIQNYLSAMCFGDFYTRGGLDLKTRELLTFCILSTLGGCENQVRAHVQGNLNVGNDKETLIAALTQCLPYIGFPRMLNALACVNEVIPEK